MARNGKNSTKRVTTISDLTPDPRNANKGTARGRKMVADSLATLGAGRSILVDRNGVVIAGNKTLEGAPVAGIKDIIVVPTDGTKLVAVQRTDLDLEADPKAKQLAIADNRAAQVGVEWDVAVLQKFPTESLSPYFTAAELRKLKVTAESAPVTDSLDKGKYVRFDFVGTSETGKTSVWNVIANEGDSLLGTVRWYASWRKYALFPNRNADLVFEQICLRDIADFCENQTALRRQKGEPPLKINASDIRAATRRAQQATHGVV